VVDDMLCPLFYTKSLKRPSCNHRRTSTFLQHWFDEFIHSFIHWICSRLSSFLS